jgi:hypothetical protein
LGPRAVLDGCGKFRPRRDSIPGPPSQRRVAIPTALSRPFFICVTFLIAVIPVNILIERQVAVI